MLLTPDILLLVGMALLPLAYYAARHFLGRLLSVKKEMVIMKHGRLRQQSLRLMQSVSQQMLAADAESTPVSGTTTYADFYRQLKSNHVTNLSDKLVVRIKKSNNPLRIEKAVQRLEKQEERLKEAEMMLVYSGK